MCPRRCCIYGQNRGTQHVVFTDVNFIEITDKVIYFAAPLMDYHWSAPDFKAWCQEEMNLWGAFIFLGEAWRNISIREFETENKCQTLFKQWSYQPFDLNISLSKWGGWWKVCGRVSWWKLPLIIRCNSLFCWICAEDMTVHSFTVSEEEKEKSPHQEQ